MKESKTPPASERCAKCYHIHMGPCAWECGCDAFVAPAASEERCPYGLWGAYCTLPSGHDGQHKLKPHVAPAAPVAESVPVAGRPPVANAEQATAADRTPGKCWRCLHEADEHLASGMCGYMDCPCAHYAPAPEDRTPGKCAVTGNTCGTDTWEVNHPCLCLPCQIYLRDYAPAPEGGRMGEILTDEQLGVEIEDAADWFEPKDSPGFARIMESHAALRARVAELERVIALCDNHCPCQRAKKASVR